MIEFKYDKYRRMSIREDCDGELELAVISDGDEGFYWLKLDDENRLREWLNQRQAERDNVEEVSS